jgi:hypothetical protein
MKDLKDKLYKFDVGSLVAAIILLICNFIPSGDFFKLILVILTSMNTGVILFNVWLRIQLKKIK